MKDTIPQILKGFRDYLPQEQIARRKMMNKISEVFERFGFAPIDTPSLEPYELLGGKYGEEGEKLMYKFLDQGEREVALRYDLTVPLARVIVQYPELPKPFKRYQMANVWRAEKPQKGRFREFIQCDVDIVGSDSINADAEVITALYQAYKALDLENVEVKFNNRELVDKVLVKLGVSKNDSAKFMRILDKLDKAGEKKVSEMLNEAGFEKNILEKYSKEMEKESKTFVEQFQELLASFGVERMKFDKYLMRGLDYYTGIVFEFTLLNKPEYGSMGGGGRYDGLIGKLTGKDLPAVGGSMGLDRLFAALSESGLIAPQTAAEVIVFNLDKNLQAEYANLATNLRLAGIDTEFYFEPAKLDKQFKYAEAKNIQVAVIFGAEESKKRQVNLKNLKEKKQITVDLDNIVSEVKSMLW